MSARIEYSRFWSRSLVAGLRIALARLRFFLLLGGVLAIVAGWPALRNLWDRLTTPGGLQTGVSPDTEYWCPMCPGVISDWPAKCPVCHMTLVVRQKGEMAPLPDGVVARMQFPPYRVQLAGIHTARVEFRPLAREVVIAGLIQARSDKTGATKVENAPPNSAPGSAASPNAVTTRLTLAADVFENDLGLFAIGQAVDLASAAYPDRVFRARVASIAPAVSESERTVQVRIEIDDSGGALRPGMLLTARIAVPIATLPGARQRALEAWRDHTTVSLCGAAFALPWIPVAGSGLDSLVAAAVHHAALHRNLLLSVPESAVIDTGVRKVVFVEQAPGLFDALEVRVGRRCGDYYPVLNGLEPGQAVVTAGAFLLDAETRLNPAAAASYFGAASRGGAASATPTAPLVLSMLSAEDRRLVERQKLCPVMDQPLGSMGVPVRVVIEGRTVFLCCEGCVPALKKAPRKYLAKLVDRND